MSKTYLLIVVLSFCLSSSVLAQDEWSMKPSKEHGILKDKVGEWDAEISMYMDPAQPPTTAKGTETVRMHGEMWAITDLSYEFMGVPVMGHGAMGFDPTKNKYVGTWHESSSAHMATMEGDYDAATKTETYVMKGKGPDGKVTTYRILMKQKDADHRSFELFVPNPEAESKFNKMVEIKYTRKSK